MPNASPGRVSAGASRARSRLSRKRRAGGHANLGLVQVLKEVVAQHVARREDDAAAHAADKAGVQRRDVVPGVGVVGDVGDDEALVLLPAVAQRLSPRCWLVRAQGTRVWLGLRRGRERGW